MKELTIEEKAKAYDEALERARNWKEKSGMPKDRQGILDDIFPELKESKDEKIRKMLIRHIEQEKGSLTNDEAQMTIDWIEKQGEQKPADKNEPKFKVGDWVMLDRPVLITKVKDMPYNTHQYWTSDGTWFGDATKAKLWTIQDAKDGDVLFQDLMGGKTFIYNGVNPDMTILYSFIISNDGEELLSYNIGKPNTGIGTIEDNKNIIYPATKEQRDLLFQKMKEAGYEWSDEIYKLKKIEQKNTEWNEEDEHKVKDTIYFLDTAKKHYASTEELDACIDWLKSLKERIGG